MTLEAAIAIAVRAHYGQKEKNGTPYVLHPLRVMLAVEGDAAQIAAVLHDVVEDTAVTLGELEGYGLAGEALEAVRLLTKSEETDYDAYLDGIRLHPIARAVKLADLEDNLDVRRLPEITPRDQDRLNRYLRGRKRLRREL